MLQFWFSNICFASVKILSDSLRKLAYNFNDRWYKFGTQMLSCIGQNIFQVTGKGSTVNECFLFDQHWIRTLPEPVPERTSRISCNLTVRRLKIRDFSTSFQQTLCRWSTMSLSTSGYSGTDSGRYSKGTLTGFLATSQFNGSKFMFFSSRCQQALCQW